MSEKRKTLQVICTECGGKYRNHRVLAEKTTVYGDSDYGVTEARIHRFVQCMGCDGFRYAVSEKDLTVQDAPEELIAVYPDAPGDQKRRKDQLEKDAGLVPGAVLKMYRETVSAVNAGALTLAAGGLRAVVEAICIEHKVVARNLQEKIDKLANDSLLTKPQADLLHEERFLGNAALHELATPRADEIEVGLIIVEGLINTLYVLPAKGQRLRSRRKSKALKDPKE